MPISKAQLGEYQHYVIADMSNSMQEPSVRMKGRTRWDEMQEHVTGLCHYLLGVDDDGITIIPFSSQVGKISDNIKTGEDVKRIFSALSPRGTTNLAAAIDAAQEHRKRLQQGKAIFHIFTDGEPDSESAVAEAIGRIVRTMNDDSETAINILQVGDDEKAGRFLKRLDDNLNFKFDIVNAMTVTESEGLSYEDIMDRALND